MQTPEPIQIYEEDLLRQDSFIITSQSAGYVYHKEGCGFARLVDSEGADWISYKPEGGEFGHFRGIPNMGLDSFGHPGYRFSAKSHLLLAESDHVQIESYSADKSWHCTWDIFPEFALHTILKIPQPYWWLYEGTPNGFMKPKKQKLMLSNGEIHDC